MHFLHPVGWGSIFPVKCCQGAWISGSWSVKGQVNIMDEAKLCSLIRSTFEALVVQCAVRCCHGEQGPFCWPLPAAGTAAFGASHCKGFTRVHKVLVDQMDSRPPSSDPDLFLSQFGFVKCFGASSWSNQWAAHCWLSYKIHFLLHVIIRWRNCLLLCRIKKRWHFKLMIFLICGQLMRHHLFELFHLSNLLQMPNNCDMIDTEFFGNYLWICKRISFNDGSQLSFSTSDGWLLTPHLQDSCFLCKTCWTTAALYVP